MFVYKLFDKRDAFPFFIICMPCIDSNIPKSIFLSAFVDDCLRNCLIEWKDKGQNSSGVEKHYPKSFEDMKKRLPILEKIVVKFFLNFIFKFDKIYYLTHDTLPSALSFCIYISDAWHFISSIPFFIFTFFDPWHFVSSFSFLWHMEIS